MTPRLPSFIIIGAAKAATSSIRVLLRNHPEVFLARGGVETRFFADDAEFARGLDWYASLFNSAPPSAILGESSNVYSERDRFPSSAQRLAEALPNAKLIYMVRDPLPRMASFWTQLRSHGGEDVHYDFEKALRLNRTLLVDSTNYWRQLAPYRERFPDSNIKILFFEDFASDPAMVMEDLCHFVGAASNPGLRTEDVHQNPSVDKTGAPVWLSRLRGNRAFRALRNLAPARLRAQLRRKLRQPIDNPEWTADGKRWVLDQLRDDSLRLLKHCNRDPAIWTLE